MRGERRWDIYWPIIVVLAELVAVVLLVVLRAKKVLKVGLRVAFIVLVTLFVIEVLIWVFIRLPVRH